MMEKNDKIIIYQTPDGTSNLDVRLEQETIWLTQKQIAELFSTETPAISKHINNIYKTGELDQHSTVSKMEIVQKEGKRHIIRNIFHYNLDMILSIGYRVNSKNATQFRIWANRILKEYFEFKKLCICNSDCSVDSIYANQKAETRQRQGMPCLCDK